MCGWDCSEWLHHNFPFVAIYITELLLLRMYIL